MDLVNRYDCATMKDAHEGAYPQFPDFKVNMPVDSPRQIRNSYDCQSAAVIRWNRDTYKIISSPNMSWIPDFPDVEERGLYQRADGHWGPQEYSIWPQIYGSAFIHHMCIPRQTSDPEMPEILWQDGIVWRTVEPSDWIELGPSPFELFTEPIGKLRLELSNELSRALELTIALCAASEKDLDSNLNGLMPQIANQARLAVEQLRREPRAERDVIQRVREVQRSIRELFGLHFYAKYVARRTFLTPPDAHPRAFRGVFVDDGVLAEELRRARIPVWFIRPYESVRYDTRIYKIVEPTSWTHVLDPHPWRSRVDGRELFMAIPASSQHFVWLRSGRPSLMTEAGMVSLIAHMRHAMGRDQGLNRDPLEIGTSLKKRSRENFDSPASPPHPSLSDDEQPRKILKSRQKKRSKASEKQGQDASARSNCQPLSFSISFVLPPYLPELPGIPPIWRTALERVSPLPVYRDAPARYYFPPPHLFSFNSSEKKNQHIHNWIRIKPFCERAAMNQSVYLTERGGLKIQDWRVALLGDYTKGHLPLDSSVATPSLVRLKDTLPSRNDLIPKIDPDAIGKSLSKIARNAHQQSIKVIFAVEGQFAPYSRSCEAIWAGRSISYDEICSDARLRARVLWDVCECQFRMDLIEADRIMTGVEGIGDSMAAGLRAYGVQRIWKDVDGSPRLFPDTSANISDVWRTPGNQSLLDGLVDVLRFWPDSPEWMTGFNSRGQSADALGSLLQDCINFYVDSFVATFHRLPASPFHVPL